MWASSHPNPDKPHITEALYLGCGALGMKVRTLYNTLDHHLIENAVKFVILDNYNHHKQIGFRNWCADFVGHVNNSTTLCLVERISNY